MSDLKISELSTESPLDGTELVEVVTGGVNKKTTTQDIADLGGGGGHVIEDEGTPLTQRTKLNFVGAGVTVTDDSGDDATVVTIPSQVVDAINNGATTTAPSENAVFDALALKNDLANTATALTDGASITITGPKHTLTTDEATITFSDSYTGDFTNIDVTFNTTAATWTFPAGSLCVVEGSASGNTTATVSGVSGDKIVISIWFVSSGVYRVVIKNFGQ